MLNVICFFEIQIQRFALEIKSFKKEILKRFKKILKIINFVNPKNVLVIKGHDTFPMTWHVVIPLTWEWVNWIAVKTTHSQVIPSQVRCSSTLFYNLFFFSFSYSVSRIKIFLLVILLYWDKRAANRWFTSQKSQSQSWISEF